MTRDPRVVYVSRMAPATRPIPSRGAAQRVDGLGPALDTLCRRYRVHRLDLFGSAARGHDFDPARSDLDLLVEFDAAAAPTAFDFLEFRDELARLFGFPVDLTMASAIRNPYLRAAIEADRRPVFAA